MKQALKLGSFLRETYVEGANFLPPTLGSGSEPSFSSKFMSDSGKRGALSNEASGEGFVRRAAVGVPYSRFRLCLVHFCVGSCLFLVLD